MQQTLENRTRYAPFEPLVFPLKTHTLLNAVRDRKAFRGIKAVLRSGLLRNDKAASEFLIVKMQKLAESGADDNRFVAELSSLAQVKGLRARLSAGFTHDERDRIVRRALQVSALIKPGPKSFIDIGCGSGEIAALLKKIWHLPKEAAIGCDVYNRLAQPEKVKYIPVEKGVIFQKSESVETAFLLMTLHHEKEPGLLFKEAYRILEPGGRLIVREHDVASISDRVFFEAMDTIYFSVFNALEEIPQPGNYKPGGYWEKLAREAGFEVEQVMRPEPLNPMRPVHIVLRKP